MAEEIQRLRKSLSSTRLHRGQNEKSLQDVVEQHLKALEVPYEREFRLNASDIPDFFLPGPGVVVEVKVSVSPDTFPQLLRYGKDPRVNEFAVVAWRLCVSPLDCLRVDGVDKPVHYIPLWKQLL